MKSPSFANDYYFRIKAVPKGCVCCYGEVPKIKIPLNINNKKYEF